MTDDLFFLLILLCITPFVFYYDIRYLRIPDIISLGSWGLALCFILFFSGEQLAGFLLNSSIALASYLLVYLISGRKLGRGDIKLSLFLGGTAGFVGWYFINLAAAVASLLFYLILLLRKEKINKLKIPFGPFLCGGALIVELYGYFL